MLWLKLQLSVDLTKNGQFLLYTTPGPVSRGIVFLVATQGLMLMVKKREKVILS